jgi:uncharacterized repeat protein (TIGR03803 family)
MENQRKSAPNIVTRGTDIWWRSASRIDLATGGSQTCYFSRMRARAVSAALAFAVMVGVIGTRSVQAQTFTTLVNFDFSNGAFPYGSLLRDPVGNLYGTTEVGGSSNDGTVFMVNTSGVETVLYNFTGGADGGNPLAGLVRDPAGNLYGTTETGGASGLGAVFKVDSKGTETVLHSFDGTDGCIPLGGLVRDKAGNLYGTTSGCGSSNFGTVFKVSKTGTEKTLHSFAGPPNDGAFPSYENLLIDTKGNLYGVTLSGGGACFNFGCGTIFKLDTTGKETVLHNFTGLTTDGCSPSGMLANDVEGNFYGTAGGCGEFSLGVVWKLSNKGTESVLHSFSGQNGVSPSGGVVIDAKGNLYGDTDGGGPYSAGVVFKLSKTGKETVLHSFALEDGETPFAGVIRDAKGNLYGTAAEGGSQNFGTVWSLSPARATTQ